MKFEQLHPRVRNIIFGAALIAVCGIVQFSCKRPAESDIKPDDGLTKTAAMVNGTVLYGSVTSGSDGQGLWLTYDDGKKYILLENPDVGQYVSVNVASAGIVLSKYGVLIKDQSNNSYQLFAKNDPTSIEQFKTVEAQLSGRVQKSLITGTTIVNNDRN